jgi:hypothetical protein
MNQRMEMAAARYWDAPQQAAEENNCRFSPTAGLYWSSFKIYCGVVFAVDNTDTPA